MVEHHYGQLLAVHVTHSNAQETTKMVNSHMDSYE